MIINLIMNFKYKMNSIKLIKIMIYKDNIAMDNLMEIK